MPSNNHFCRVCGSPTRFLWKGSLLDLSVRYFECDTCGYVQTEQPYWLERAYTEAINDSDTGIMQRNLSNARIVLATLLVLGKLKGKVVDCAGGYGILVRLLRDNGVDALWADRYCENLVARGFAHQGEPADLVTAFEAFEHFIDPPAELNRLLAIAGNVLISTQLMPRPTPKQDDWWYYGRDHGQHIGFLRIKTLQTLAQKHGTYLISDGHSYHLFSRDPINKMAWRLFRKASSMVSPLAKLRVGSLTWSDHLSITARKHS